ncbi:Aac3-VI [Escherichia coli]|nr:Aac3-VI [Escherichia coli]
MMTDPRKNGDLHEPATAPATPWSKSELVRQLRDLGVRSGDMVMPHVSLRAVGPLADGPQTLVDALIEAVGPTGNILAFVSWRDSPYEQTLGHDAPPAAIAQSWPAFDPDHAPAYPGFGAINEFIRTYPGCRRSAHPDASMAAIGPDAAWLVAPHEMGAAYGPRSPIARFLAHAGKILSIGAGPDAVTRAPLCRSGGADRGQAPRHLFDALTARRQARLGHHVRLGFERHPRRICRADGPTRSNGSPATISPAPGLRKARSAARNPG